ncbi:zinc finger protein 335-like isoform X1 [Sander lucioperca]|uniref:zinc finger protein 335-like isoform X1 n=1 Tax=Sander lucioperca TaxID=283035 RepID=UPI001653CE1B|nr:zinc finger protein 335-like isoform X1 [Sander lucioperca]
MSWVKQRYRDITPVTLQVAGGAVSAVLYCGEPEGLAGGLVESFLVELYRCKLCQFTCSLKASVSSHLRTHLTYLGADGGGGAQDGEGAGPYPLELNQEEEEEKRSDEDEDFLLYNMLDDMSPPTCDISSEGGLQVAHTCEYK